MKEHNWDKIKWFLVQMSSAKYVLKRHLDPKRIFTIWLRGLACCGSWGYKESDMTEWLNWTELNWIICDAEHLLKCFLFICCSSLERCLFRSSTYFLTELWFLFVFWYLAVWDVCLLEINQYLQFQIFSNIWEVFFLFSLWFPFLCESFEV